MMLNRLKVLGPALIAVLAMSAMAASSASALTGEIEVEGGGSATVTGEQISGEVTGVENTGKNELTTRFGVIKCTPSTFHGVAANGSKELTLTATYGNTAAGTGCTPFGPVVHMNGCHYIFTIAAGGTTAETHAVCPVGAVIDITSPLGCTITIPGGQTFAASRVALANSGGANPNMDVKATIDITGIDYVLHNVAPGTCPNGGDTGTATQTDGTYKGVVTLKGDVVGGGAKSVTIK